jgi:hypothetical protein
VHTHPSTQGIPEGSKGHGWTSSYIVTGPPGPHAPAASQCEGEHTRVCVPVVGHSYRLVLVGSQAVIQSPQLGTPQTVPSVTRLQARVSSNVVCAGHAPPVHRASAVHVRDSLPVVAQPLG